LSVDSALDTFERTAVAALLEGDHPVLEHLRSQMAEATVRDREQGEFGRFTDLWVDAEPIDVDDRFAIDDVYGRVIGVDDEVALLLHVVRGRLKTLEAFVPRPIWPERPELVETWYVAPDSEDAGQLHRIPGRSLDFALRGLTVPRDED
jgi:hypothetical protein